MTESIGFVVNSKIANIHVAPNEGFKKLSATDQENAKKELVRDLKRVLDQSSILYLAPPPKPSEQIENEGGEEVEIW